MSSEPKTPSSRKQYKAFTRAFREGGLDAQSAKPEDDKARAQGNGLFSNLSWRDKIRKWSELTRLPKREIAAVFILACCGVAMTLSWPMLVRYLIDHVVLIESLSVDEKIKMIAKLGAAMFILLFGARVVDFLRIYRLDRMNISVILRIRKKLFSHLARQPFAVLDELKVGGIASRLLGDVNQFQGILNTAVITPAVSSLRILIVLGLIVYINWRLAVIALLVVPVIFAISYGWIQKLRPVWANIQRNRELVSSMVTETFSGIKVVRAFSAEKRQERKYLSASNAIARKELFAKRRSLVLGGSWDLLTSVSNLAITCAGCVLIVRNLGTIGDLLAFQLYTFMLLSPVRILIDSLTAVQASLAAIDRVYEILDKPVDAPVSPSRSSAVGKVQSIRFDAVSFGYRKDRLALRDINLTIVGNSTIALVGRSGAGKTTFANLVARFYEPTQGAIYINGVDLKEYSTHSYRQAVAIVEQDVFLFDGTVRENISIAKPSASDEEIEAAAKMANAHEFIVNLKDGYESSVGQRGAGLSGGQRQRIGIARAFIKNPEILILDEATSSLDTLSERKVQDALKRLLANRTTFIIAHRLSTITHADLILVFDRGVVRDMGTHEELMGKRGYYCEVLREQRATLSVGGASPRD